MIFTKAKEYYEKYKANLISEDKDISIQAIQNLLQCLSKEVGEKAKQRNAVSDRATLSILKEQNDKWNAIVNLFEKEFNGSPIIRDGFIIFWKKEIPALKTMLDS